ncbi:MAG: TRC40/GET3/ArsA family transport-energizing ATPase [Candidatus Rokubacteria bacterium]|nr:TRC40/GET3/ArsA family transport-energizing ATPase [Candidatus Rokubacteria bacterium]
MQTIAQLFEARPRLKYVFTGGKGGVGKTVSAAALAYHFSREGRKILLASLNPVHSLSSVFGQDLRGGTIRPVSAPDLVGKLYASEVEATDVVDRYRVNIAHRVREFLKWADIPVDAKPFVNIAVTNPAFEEAAMFDKMVDIMLTEGENYDAIVFDTAAVANAVRLIGLSKIYGLWLGRMIQSRQEALSMKIQYAFRKEKVMDEVKKDPLMSDLLSMNARFRQVKGVLVDPEQTAFFFVTLPLALPIAVVKRFINMVRSYDIAIGGVIVNQLIKRETAAASPGDEYLQGKFTEQLGYARTIKRDLGDLVRGFVPLYPKEVTGVEKVVDVANDILGFVPDFWPDL